MLSILPPEILRIIFASVDDRKTFCNILVTSRQFSQLVEPFLCAEIDFSELPLLAAAINLRSLKGLYDALEASNWRQTAYIRTFSSNFGSPVEGRTLIEKILTKTVNLKSLCLYSGHTSLRHFLRGHAPFTLTHFRGIFRCLGPEITRFLESQTSLETIHIFLTEPSKAQLPVFAPTSFPNLKTLTIVPGLVLPFLRTSANVRNLRLNECEDFPPVSKQDKACMASVRVLSCFPLSAASSLASQFPKLEWLEFSNGRSDIPTLMGWSQGSHTLRGILVHRSTTPFSHDFLMPSS
ncbi:hypothetical protein CCMSSC00406_0010246 [Pleurotus cornucopiae]|uniref:Uncharacterized protein n=1 Tax=Pleurotus cornucopiae TaxID=5321 RepID=A0ACB7IIP6_PLECO|nr:hypothetical protein CCMSSC00406_0010246 [Pleurotus cornucopiae]